MIAEVARSGLYDILAHPDLVKYWGGERAVPERDPRFYYEPAVEAIADTGIAVEVSTAGLRKPVAELYPADAFAEMCVDAGACFALSSDAHVPEDVFRERRAQLLRGFLARPRIYRTDAFHDALEARARENLQKSCAA